MLAGDWGCWLIPIPFFLFQHDPSWSVWYLVSQGYRVCNPLRPSKSIYSSLDQWLSNHFGKSFEEPLQYIPMGIIYLRSTFGQWAMMADFLRGFFILNKRFMERRQSPFCLKIVLSVLNTWDFSSQQETRWPTGDDGTERWKELGSWKMSVNPLINQLWTTILCIVAKWLWAYQLSLIFFICKMRIKSLIS